MAFLTYQSMSALFHSGGLFPLGTLGVNAFNHLWKFQVSYVFPPPALSPLVLSKFLVEHVTSQFRPVILVVPCWRESSLSAHHVGRCSSSVSHCKGYHHSYFSRPGDQGSTIDAFNPLAAQRCLLYRWEFSPSVSRAIVGVT